MRGRMEGADKVEVRFRGSKGDRGRKVGILVRTVDTSDRERGAIELLLDQIRSQARRGVPSSLPLMTYRSGESGECGRKGG